MQRRRARVLSAALIIWAAAWIALAVQVAVEVRGLSDLSTTVRKTGEAVRESGAALETLESVPVVGDQLRGPAQRIQAAGEDAINSGRSSRDSIRRLSVLLAVAIGVIPVVAVLGLFVQLRGGQRADGVGGDGGA